ncbi:MAG TPA: hypothetical protein VMW47_00435 [Verrucomicrobiae bacterium]|nr:hypothetical protein [Verrucomicrobiae bacterium]
MEDSPTGVAEVVAAGLFDVAVTRVVTDLVAADRAHLVLPTLCAMPPPEVQGLADAHRRADADARLGETVPVRQPPARRASEPDDRGQLGLIPRGRRCRR